MAKIDAFSDWDNYPRKGILIQELKHCSHANGT